MRSLSEVETQILEWKQVRIASRSYELYTGAAVVARLEWRTKPGAVTRAYTAEAGWILHREGSISAPRISIRSADTGGPIADFSTQGGGLLRLVDGRRFYWIRRGFWRTEGSFAGPDGAPLIDLRLKNRPFKAGARVEISPQATTGLAAADRLFLIVVAWYLVRLKADDDAIAAAAAVAGIVATSG